MCFEAMWKLASNPFFIFFQHKYYYVKKETHIMINQKSQIKPKHSAEVLLEIWSAYN